MVEQAQVEELGQLKFEAECLEQLPFEQLVLLPICFIAPQTIVAH